MNNYKTTVDGWKSRKDMDHLRDMIEHDRSDMYLDYVNNFLTVSCFAEHYGFTDEQASELIRVERIKHNERCK